MARIQIESASRVFEDAGRPAVDRLDLDVADGEFLVLVGPSGCGKSTSLRMIAGLEPVDTGRILIGGDDVGGLPPGKRDIAMVFQNYALYPTMTVAKNMAFALKNRKMPKDEIERRVARAAKILELDDLLDRKPAALSGGQRQRVAMGRAIVREPAAFLMDEPLSNLDARLRVATRAQITALHRRLKATTVYVTHDQTEAMTMGDRIAVLRGGVLQQVGTPEELYQGPVNEFVAGFLGSPAMNLLPGRVDGGQALVGEWAIPLVDEAHEGPAQVGIRPEELAPAGEEGTPVVVDHVENLGREAFIYATLPGDVPVTVAAGRPDGTAGPGPGERVRVAPRPGAPVHLFDTESGQRIHTAASR
ncbi:ABC transporter ATP-binding protein [Corynebacterium otitidis]|uniref:Trehalose import ATP-binding protein SugC n=1 Tax=Corynebacterium otitidis ATCC 51513 TaxID=883169 RepID=I7KJP3_9CORY|nr:sn-glycerol-3-phosphate ABC transporter ATP-binding protein UgpC [Corynebacterium otitidis]EJZ81823.1 hypothetical protein HMPREF9719_01244 [Corynebacterium otitidis ATCC 51513]KKO84170.1 ABC transporter ATPase [Corynebacterium otitidis]CCI83750.1 sn-glycerol-3-phosphate import ATP-binding protein ugpC [Corynebacterium otitidis ATCC 51513]